MITNLLYLCPDCGGEETLHATSDKLSCLNCGSHYPLINGRMPESDARELYDRVRERLSVEYRPQSGYLRQSGPARLRQGVDQIVYSGFEGRKSDIELPREIDTGFIEFHEDEFVFVGKKQKYHFSLQRLQCFTTNSHYFEFKISGEPFWQFDFENETPLKYEDLFAKWLDRYFGKKFIEHQPRLITGYQKKYHTLLARDEINHPERRERFSIPEFFLHHIVGRSIVNYVRFRAGLQVSNTGLIPKKGPFVLLVNHESYVDPMLFTSLMPRRIGFFTKSTAYSNPVIRWVFRAYRTIPTRRYENDHQVIFHARDMLREGYPIGIFPEGERSWDGRLLPFKKNTVRFLLSVEVPIVVARISGAYRFFPRWGNKPGKGPVKIEVLTVFSARRKNWTIDAFSAFLEAYYR